MATYVVLFNWTDQGIQSFRDSVSRSDAAKDLMAPLGITLKDIYWTVGPHDLVATFEAPDDESLAAALLTLGAAGNVRTTTMRAFSKGEFEAIAARAGS